MVFAKTSILLFCLILGTSVFSNGSSTGLASAKPAIRSEAYELLGINVPNLNQNFRRNLDYVKIYGSITNQQGAVFHDENVSGPVFYGSTTSQNNNIYH
uniref:Uncharacterized protein n=1 Tax=Glyptapanteles flavicoxis TaxID=463051 RepID=B7S897_9HYME|nr:hypothetical protein GFP_L7_0630 [Glyptapanteles flavicoxis]